MNLKLLKSKLYEEIIDDFNKNKDVYMFYLSPIIFKLKTKDFSNYKYSLFSKIKNKELTTFKHYKLNKYLKKDYEKDLRTIIKIVFKSNYIDKNNKYALFHIKKILSRKTKLCYINLIYRLLTDINKIPGGAGFFTDVYNKFTFKSFDLPKDKLTKLYYKYYDNFKSTIFKGYANDDDFVNSTIIKITYPDTDINEIISNIYTIYIRNNIIGYDDIKSNLKIIITDNFIQSYKMLNSYNYSINFEELFKDIYTHNINFTASINKLLYTESPVLYQSDNSITKIELENEIFINSYKSLYELINQFDIFLHNKIQIIFGYYYNLILYDYITIFNISNDKIPQFSNFKEYSNIFNDENKLYYTAFIIFYSYIYNLNALNTYINENKFFNKSQITYDEYLKNRELIDRIITSIDKDIIETYDKLYDNKYIYNSSILNLELNDLINIYIYKKFIITNNIIFTNTDELEHANYSILLKLYMKANCDYLLLIISKFNITSYSNIIYHNITHVLKFFQIYSKLYMNLGYNNSISSDEINNYMIKNLNQEFHNFKHFNITTKEYIDVSVVDIYNKYHKFIQDIDNFLSINTDLKIKNLELFKKLIYETSIKDFEYYINGGILSEDIISYTFPPNSDKILNIQKEIIIIIILRIKEFNIAEIREYTDKYDLLSSTQETNFKDLYELYEKIIKLYNNFLTDINISKIIESIDIDREKFLIYYTQEKLESFNTNISKLKEKLRSETFDSEFYNLKSKIINTYNTYLYKVAMNKTIESIDIESIDIDRVKFLIYTQEKLESFKTNISKFKEKLRSEIFDLEFYNLNSKIINTYNTYLYKVAMNKTIDEIKKITLDKKIIQDIKEFKAKASGDEYNKVIVAYNNSIIDLNKTIIKSIDIITNMKHLEQSSNEINKEINKEIMKYNREISNYEQQKKGGNSQLQNDKLELLLSNIYKNIKLISI